MSKKTELHKREAGAARDAYVDDIESLLNAAQANGRFIPDDRVGDFEAFIALSLQVLRSVNPLEIRKAATIVEARHLTRDLRGAE